MALQTWPAVQTIVRDNGSDDGTVDIAHQWIPARLPGSVVYNQPLPLHKSLAAMVERCRTPYCARIDGDDLSEPRRLELQTLYLERHPSIALLGSQVTPIDSNGNLASLHYPLPNSYPEIQDRLLITNCISHPSVLFRTETIKQVGSYMVESPVEDYDLWLRLAASHRLENLSERLIRYRVHPASTTHKAIRSSILQNAIDEAWLSNAFQFCGLKSRMAAQSLRNRRIAFALPVFYRISATLSGRDGVPVLRRFARQSFNRACRAHVGSKDIITRAFLKFTGGLVRPVM
jgi:glycosyltransferase involved in cell wall biosynthesis